MVGSRLCWASLAGLLAFASSGCSQERRALVPPPIESQHQSLILRISGESTAVTHAVTLGSATWPLDFSLPEFAGLNDASIRAFAYEASLAELQLEEGLVIEPTTSAPCARSVPSNIWQADEDSTTGWRDLPLEQVDLTPLLGPEPCVSNTDCREFGMPVIRYLDVDRSIEALEVLGPGRFFASSRKGGAWEVGPQLTTRKLEQFDDWLSFGSVTAPDGQIWLGGTMGQIRIVDPQTLTSTTIAVPTSKSIANISFSPVTEKVLVVATNLGLIQESPSSRYELEIFVRDGSEWQRMLRFDTDRTSFSQVTSVWIDDSEAIISHGGVEGIRIVGETARLDDTLSYAQAFIRSGDDVYMGLRATGVFRRRPDGSWLQLVPRVVGRGPEGFLAVDGGLIVGLECGYLFEVLPDGTPCSVARFNDFDVEILRSDSLGTLAFVGGTIGAQGTPVVFVENAL